MAKKDNNLKNSQKNNKDTKVETKTNKAPAKNKKGKNKTNSILKIIFFNYYY